jgi:hypothetical protein
MISRNEELDSHRSVPGSKPPLTLSAFARSINPAVQADESPTMTATSALLVTS